MTAVSNPIAAPSAIVKRLQDCQPAPVQWLWTGRLPAGKVTLLAGDPGLGKSLVTLDLAARLSRGRNLPYLAGEPTATSAPASVVLLSAEDDVNDTIGPRLAAADADLSRIVALEAVGLPDAGGGAPREVAFSLASDLDVLEQVVRAADNCRLVVIDPITAYLGDGDSHNNAEMRSLLAPLSDLAARTGVAVLAVNHLNKNSQGPALYRSMGSLAFAATARSVLAVLADPYDQQLRIVVSLKSNLAAAVEGLRYRVGGTTAAVVASSADSNGSGLSVPLLQWETTPVRMTADELLAAAAQSAAAGPAITEAAEWLATTLRDGPRPAVELKQQARSDGIHERTLLRAKQRLGIVAQRQGFGPHGKWSWRLAKP